MFFAKAIFCRAFQASFRAALPFLPYREPEIIGSCEGLSEVIKKERIRSAMIVTDKGILKNGLTLPLPIGVLTRSASMMCSRSE